MARLLDGIVPFCCKLTHAHAHPQHHEREQRRLCIGFLPYGTKMLTRGGRDSTCREFEPLRNFADTSHTRELSLLILPPSVLGTSCGGGGVNGSGRQDGGGGRRWLSRAPTGRRWRSGNDVRGRRRNERDARRRRTRNRGRGGAGWRWGAPSSASSGRNLLLEGGGGDIAIAVAATSTARAAARMRCSRIADVRRKETRGIETMPRRGEDDPPQDTREFRLRGSRRVTMMLALEICLSSRILSSAETFPYFVKMHVFSLDCSPKTGITSLIIKGFRSFRTTLRHSLSRPCRHHRKTTASKPRPSHE